MIALPISIVLILAQSTFELAPVLMSPPWRYRTNNPQGCMAPCGLWWGEYFPGVYGLGPRAIAHRSEIKAAKDGRPCISAANLRSWTMWLPSFLLTPTWAGRTRQRC